MLDGPANAAGDVKIRTHGLAGLAHLVFVRDPSGVNGRPRSPHSPAEDVRQLLNRCETVRTTYTPAAANNDGGIIQAYRARTAFEVDNLS